MVQESKNVPISNIPAGLNLLGLINYLNKIFLSIKSLLSGNISYSHNLCSEIASCKVDGGTCSIKMNKRERPKGIMIINSDGNFGEIIRFQKSGEYLQVTVSAPDRTRLSFLIIYR